MNMMAHAYYSIHKILNIYVRKLYNTVVWVQASSEYGAERQLNDLLFPRIHGKHQKKKKAQQSEL